MYKMILGKPVTIKDMESVDADFHRSLTWMMYDRTRASTRAPPHARMLQWQHVLVWQVRRAVHRSWAALDVPRGRGGWGKTCLS